MMSGIGIDITGITASYDDPKRRKAGAHAARPIFSNLKLRVPHSQVAVVVGPSGAGKTTLLNCVAGLQRIDHGYVALALGSKRGSMEHGHDKFLTAFDRRRIGVAFQQSNLWSHFCVLDNLVHPQMKLAGRSKADAMQWAEQLLDDLLLHEHALKPVTALSGGQRQRVAIARALSLHPDIVLFDEITANQDPENVQRVYDLIRNYVSTTGATALTVSHDMGFVRKIADTVAFLSDGVIRVQATPEQFFNHCDDEIVQRFLKAF